MRRLRHLLRRARQLFPLTGAGLTLGAISALALLGPGLARQDLLLLVLGGLGLALVGVALAAVVLVSTGLALSLWRRLPGPPLRVECGQSGPTGLSLPGWIPLVSLRVAWRAPAVEASLEPLGRRVVEVVRPQRRGAFDRAVRELTVAEPFGLARVTLRYAEALDLRFEPGVGALRNIQVVRGLAGGDQLSHPEGDPTGDRVDMRRYSDGDPIRYVLWKVFARSRRLVVRTPERAMAPSPRTSAYLVTGPDDEAAAGAARLAIEEGSLGGAWRLGADGGLPPAEERGAAMDLIVRSAGTPPGAEAGGLAAFLAEEAAGARARVVIFTPARPGPWLARLTEALAGQPQVSPELIVCADGLTHAPARARRAWWLLPGPEGEAPRPEELLEVTRALSALGPCTVLDREDGTVFSATLLDARRTG